MPMQGFEMEPLRCKVMITTALQAVILIDQKMHQTHLKRKREEIERIRLIISESCEIGICRLQTTAIRRWL